MATRAREQRGTSVNDAVEAARRDFVSACKNYLNKSNGDAGSRFVSAAEDQAKALIAAGMPEQAGWMTKVYKYLKKVILTLKTEIIDPVLKTFLLALVRYKCTLFTDNNLLTTVVN